MKEGCGTTLISDLMHQSGVVFGTSGARGLVEAMTDHVCYAYTTAFLQHLELGKKQSSVEPVAIAGDLRPSTPRIMAAVAKAVKDSGRRPLNCGFVPSPAVALYGIQQKIPSIMVTGSHIPDDRNGIKFNKPTGEILKQDEESIRNQTLSLPSKLFDNQGRSISPEPLPVKTPAPYEVYLKRYLEFFAPGYLEGRRIGLYEHSSVSRKIIAEILEAFGADVVHFGFSDSFIPVDTEAIRPQDVVLAKKWASDHRLDSIVSTDGDGDRPLISDEKGNWLRGDVAGILCARFLEADVVVTPVSSNSAVEKCGWFEGVFRTQIGSPYVIAEMNQLLAEGREAVVGYEANGGFLTADRLEKNGRTLDPLPTRDAMIVILCILGLAKELNTSISRLLELLPSRYTQSDRLKDFPADLSKRLIGDLSSGSFGQNQAAIEMVFGEFFGKVRNINKIDGLRVTFESDEVVHLRPSGNAPELRCYTEADSEERATIINKICMNILKGWR